MFVSTHDTVIFFRLRYGFRLTQRFINIKTMNKVTDLITVKALINDSSAGKK